jgi:hypothetical protein
MELIFDVICCIARKRQIAKPIASYDSKSERQADD